MFLPVFVAHQQERLALDGVASGGGLTLVWESQRPSRAHQLIAILGYDHVEGNGGIL